MSNVEIELNEQQVSLLLGVLHEFTSLYVYESEVENRLHNEVVEKLQEAENCLVAKQVS